MLVLKQTIQGGHGSPWFYPTLIGMPERLFLPIVWSEDPGAAKVYLMLSRKSKGSNIPETLWVAKKKC